jgi:hypothetical protein
MKMHMHLTIIMQKMFDMVGETEKPDEGYCSSPSWFTNHEWTSEQEDEYVDWLAQYLYTNRKAQIELVERSGRKMSKKRCRTAASAFVTNYGWKLKMETPWTASEQSACTT